MCHQEEADRTLEREVHITRDKPHEHENLSQVELLFVDEPVVKSLLGPYLVFLSHTVDGYEGTGRSLSLKLLQQLEEQTLPNVWRASLWRKVIGPWSEKFI